MAEGQWFIPSEEQSQVSGVGMEKLVGGERRMRGSRACTRKESVGVTVESQGERSLLRAQRNLVGTWVRATVAKDTCL